MCLCSPSGITAATPVPPTLKVAQHYARLNMHRVGGRLGMRRPKHPLRLYFVRATSSESRQDGFKWVQGSREPPGLCQASSMYDCSW